MRKHCAVLFSLLLATPDLKSQLRLCLLVNGLLSTEYEVNFNLSNFRHIQGMKWERMKLTLIYNVASIHLGKRLLIYGHNLSKSTTVQCRLDNEAFFEWHFQAPSIGGCGGAPPEYRSSNSVCLFVCLFVQGYDCSFASQIECVFAEFPRLVMGHEAIEWSVPMFATLLLILFAISTPGFEKLTTAMLSYRWAIVHGVWSQFQSW